ncbi:MAG: response regulator [bacterium]|nr:response regulator [bacterium]
MSEEFGNSAVTAEPPRKEESTEISRIGGQFLASLNHDIRTPLSGIMGMTDLLFETDLNGEQKDYVQTTRLCADQLLEMLNSALEFSALSAGSLRTDEVEYHLPQSLRELVNEHLPKAEAKGLTLACHLADDLPEYVMVDPVRLRQVITPLVSNALKFTPRGEVEVIASAKQAFDSRITFVVSVRDTGVGIPADKLQDIFESFQQLESGLSRTYAGLGLGLAVARKLAGIMGGNIAVESQVGVGSTFHLTIPLRLSTEQPDEAAAAEHAAATQDQRQRILLVEDNEVARRVVTHILGRADYYVHCANGGREGIEAASQFRYEVILMDLQMPDVNGLEATAAIRRLPGHARTPIIAVTANYSDEFRARCRDAGLQGFLSKPVQAEELVRTIQKYIHP